MNYVCKVFTPEFKAKFEAILAQEVEKRMKEKGIAPERQPIAKSFLRHTVMDSIYAMWNNPEIYDKYPIALEYYQSLGISQPEFTELIFKAQEQGLQSQPRIEWEGKIQKIDDIVDIFSFRTE